MPRISNRGVRDTPWAQLLIGGMLIRSTVGRTVVPLEDTEVKLNGARPCLLRTLTCGAGRGSRRDITLCLGIRNATLPGPAQAGSFRTRDPRFVFHAALWRPALSLTSSRLQAIYNYGTSSSDCSARPVRFRQTSQHRHEPLVVSSLRSESQDPGTLTLDSPLGVRFYTDNNRLSRWQNPPSQPLIRGRDILFTPLLQGYGRT